MKLLGNFSFITHYNQNPQENTVILKQKRNKSYLRSQIILKNYLVYDHKVYFFLQGSPWRSFSTETLGVLLFHMNCLFIKGFKETEFLRLFTTMIPKYPINPFREHQIKLGMAQMRTEPSLIYDTVGQDCFHDGLSTSSSPSPWAFIYHYCMSLTLCLLSSIVCAFPLFHFSPCHHSAGI